MHKNARRPINTQAWSDIELVDGGGVYIKSVHAFLKKKHAKEWLQEKGYGHLEIVPFEVCG